MAVSSKLDIAVVSMVFLAQMTLGPSIENSILNLFALHSIQSPFFRPHQLVTYLFLHDPEHFAHILYNMFALWMFGAILENYWGAKRFLIFYTVCGIGAAVFHLAVLYPEMTQYVDGLQQYAPEARDMVRHHPGYGLNGVTLGASGAVFGCLAGFGYLFPNSLIYLYFFVPIKVKWFVLGYAAIELFSGISASAGDNVAHWAHLGGGLVGLLLVIYWNKSNRRNFY